MSYVDFCCRSGGSNLNAGTRTGNSTIPGTSADFTYASGTWVAGTGVFTVASGDPAAAGVAVGDYASVYPDGSTVTPFVGRVTARTSTTITVSLTIKMGTAPTDGTGNRTLKIGGAWAGPSGSVTFPFALLNTTVTPTVDDILCLNVKSDVTASMTANITCSLAGPYQVSGFATTYRDESGKWTISGATTGASYIALTISGARAFYTDMVIANNGATGTAVGLSATGGRFHGYRLSVSETRGAGMSVTGVCSLYECETFACNKSNTASSGGFVMTSSGVVNRCFSHDNTGSNNNGFVSTGGNVLVIMRDCISDSNGKSGFLVNGSASLSLSGCDFYNNGTNGLLLETNSSVVTVENSNFVLNATYGVRCTVAGVIDLQNCGFPAAGTTANGTDISSTSGVITNDAPITIAANTTPWNAPGTGDFRITATSNKGTGRGAFTSLGSGKTGTVAYPDVGAAQSTGGGGASNILIPCGGFSGGFNRV